MAFLTYPRNGFTATRRFDEQYVRNYKAQASTNQSISLFDAVSIVNGVVVPCSAGQDPGQAGFGVVVGIYTSANRPLTQQVVKIISSGSDGRVDVFYDPNGEFVVRCDTSVGPSNIDKNVILNVSASNPLLGISGQSVDIPASASANDLFRLVRMADQNDIVGLNGFNTAGGSGQGVVVRWNRHVYKAGTAGQ